MSQYLESAKLPDFLDAVCAGRELYALESIEGALHLVRTEHWQRGKHELGAVRPVEPLKSVYFQPREAVGRSGLDEGADRKTALVGVKNCDLASLRVHDYVFAECEPADPAYVEARERTLLITCDCTDCLDVCFCTLVGDRPYAEEGFDINLSPVPGGYLVDTGSERGTESLAGAAGMLRAADAKEVAQRAEARKALSARVTAQAAKSGLKPEMDFRAAIRTSADSDLWGDFAVDCVECGACNFACCTCHCFLLNDGVGQDSLPRRVKQWDSCLYRNFATVAGGANPRTHRAERLHNRFDKKFNFFPEVLGVYACDGCGRCIGACTGKIDIREVLKRAVDES